MKTVVLLLSLFSFACSRRTDEHVKRTNGSDSESVPLFELFSSGPKGSITLPPLFSKGLLSELENAYRAKEKWIDSGDFIYHPIYAHINSPGEQIIVSKEFLFINQNNQWVKLEGPFTTKILKEVIEMVRTLADGNKEDMDIERVRREFVSNLEAFSQ